MLKKISKTLLVGGAALAMSGSPSSSGLMSLPRPAEFPAELAVFSGLGFALGVGALAAQSRHR